MRPTGGRTGGSALERELEALKARIEAMGGPPPDAPPPADPVVEAAAEAHPAFADLFADLRREAETLAAEADAEAHRHPFVVAAAAFLLGVAVGRLVSGGR